MSIKDQSIWLIFIICYNIVVDNFFMHGKTNKISLIEFKDKKEIKKCT